MIVTIKNNFDGTESLVINDINAEVKNLIMEEILPYEEMGLGKPGLEEGKNPEVENYYYGGQVLN